MKKTWNVKFRETCLQCGNPITQNRFRTFCSKTCRGKNQNKRYYEAQLNWSRKKRGEYSPDKVRCLICGRYYVQVGSHVFGTHGITSREYREQYGFPVKKGIVPLWYKKLKGDLAIKNKTYQNLKKGKKYWYKIGDPRARINTFFKGKSWEIKRFPQEVYPHG